MPGKGVRTKKAPRSAPRSILYTHSGVATYPPGATFGPRDMRDFEFVWLIDGDAEYTVDGVIHAAPQGSFVLCRPGTVDLFTWDRNRRTQHGYLHFNIGPPLSGLPPHKQWPAVVVPPNVELLEPLFRHLLSDALPGDAGVIERAVELMLHVFVNGPRRSAALDLDLPPDPVGRTMDYLYRTLEADAASPITLDELAEAACVTPEHLCRLFKKSMGRSPMEVARLARLDRAATLLTRTNFAIGRIAELCGFASQFHFARLFKAAFGGTPSDIRRDVRTGGIPPLPRLIHQRKMPKHQKQA